MNGHDQGNIGPGPQMSPIERMLNLLRYVPREYAFHSNENGWTLHYPKFIQGQVVKIERSFQTIEALVDFVRIHERDISRQQKGLSGIVTPDK